MRRTTAVATGGLLAIVLTIAGLAGWLRFRDPVGALPREAPAQLPHVEETVERGHGRLLTRVTLEGSAVGTVRFFVSRPDPIPTRRLPLMVVVPGQRTGPDAISLLGDLGSNAVAWFVWPLPADLRWGGELVWQLPGLYREALSVPGQLDAVLHWASQQPWVDRDRVSLLGYSLGALVVPAAKRLSQEGGDDVGWTILAYGGAPLGAVLEVNPNVKTSWLRPPIRVLVDLLLRPVEPSIHLPRLRGRFLVLGGKADPLIPHEAAERMRRLTPRPRTIILFEGQHIGTSAAERRLLDPVVAASKSWLIEQGAIEPPERRSSASASPCVNGASPTARQR